MNKSNEIRTKIRTDLNWIRSEIIRLNDQHICDFERNTDRFFCGLLNLTENWNLGFAYRGDAAYTFADLVDPDAGIAVSVKVSHTKAAIRKTVDLFSEKLLTRGFTKLILLSLTPDIAVLQKLPLPQYVHFLSFDMLLEKIETLSPETIDAISDYLSGYIDARTVRLRYPLPSPPLSSANFVLGSRNQELEKLGKMLKGKEPIFIWGLGGMGKTETVIQLAKQYAPPKGAYFIRCALPDNPDGDILRQTILSANFNGYQFTGIDNASRDQEYRERLDILKHDYRSSMLIIDNLDSPEQDLDQILASPTYRDLKNLNIRLIFTTRSSVTQENSLEIGPLTKENLLHLMRSFIISDDFSEAQLTSLIDAADHHTLMVELMARILEESWGEVTPESLRDALTNSRLKDAYFPEIPSEQNRKYKIRQLYAHMKSLFDISDLCEDEQTILRYATLLPDEGMNLDLFTGCLPEHQAAYIKNLVRRGWIRKTEDRYRMHLVIREVCRGELMPTAENCKVFLVQLANRFDLSREYNKSCFHQIAKCFSIAAAKLADPTHTWAAYAIVYQNLLGGIQNPENFLHRMEGRYAQISTLTPLLRAAAYTSGGIAYRNHGDYLQAQKYLNMALEEFEQMDREQMSTAERQALAITYSNVGSTYHTMGDYPQALENHQKALHLREEILPPNHPHLANSYCNVGITYGGLEDYPQALIYLQKSLDIRRRKLTPNHPDLARSYVNVGLIYSALGRHPAALDHQLKALGIFMRSLPEDHMDLALSFNYVGLAFDAMKEHEEAMEYCQRALGILERVLPPDHPELARIHNNIGQIYSSMGDHSTALKYKRKALHIREKELPAGHPDFAVSYNKIARSYFDLKNYKMAREYEEKALHILEGTLPPTHPRLARSYSNIASSCIALKEYQAALEYLGKVLNIREAELSSDHPALIDIKRKLQYVQQLAAEQNTLLKPDSMV